MTARCLLVDLNPPIQWWFFFCFRHVHIQNYWRRIIPRTFYLLDIGLYSYEFWHCCPIWGEKGFVVAAMHWSFPYSMYLSLVMLVKYFILFSVLPLSVKWLWWYWLSRIVKKSLLRHLQKWWTKKAGSLNMSERVNCSRLPRRVKHIVAHVLGRRRP